MLYTYVDISAHVEAEMTFRALARTDFLTGIASRMYFFESAEREFARSVRHKTPLTLLALDLDHFKNINDQHGHSHGDRVLQSFVETVGTYLRSTDVFGRTGGEEFCILLPDTDLAGAHTLAKRIVKGVRQYPAMVGKQALHYTVSVGVSERGPQHANFEALMVHADQQLYRAKALGRDRVEVANAAPM
jgi:diguanylate cyclase (GGDEF)-like protein